MLSDSSLLKRLSDELPVKGAKSFLARDLTPGLKVDRSTSHSFRRDLGEDWMTFFEERRKGDWGVLPKS